MHNNNFVNIVIFTSESLLATVLNLKFQNFFIKMEDGLIGQTLPLVVVVIQMETMEFNLIQEPAHNQFLNMMAMHVTSA